LCGLLKEYISMTSFWTLRIAFFIFTHSCKTSISCW